jgi:hypothetical protein
MSLWIRWRQKRLRRAGKKADRVEERGHRQQWFLLAGRADLPVRRAPDARSLTPILPPDNAFWADPFLWSRDGRRFVFFEEYSFAARKGHISFIELDDRAHPLGRAMKLIDEPHHLSYPYLFEYGGELYMTPEKADTGRVDRYRCVEFPFRWEPCGTLIDGIRLTDPTLFEHEGRWWLLCSARQAGLHPNESLLAFWSRTPLSDKWTPHPANPLVRDFTRGRPGGRVLRDGGGRLFRPAQDCLRRYGHGLSLNEITLLSPGGFVEREVWHASGEDTGGWRGMHHLDWQRGILVMDAQHRIPLPAVEHGSRTEFA